MPHKPRPLTIRPCRFRHCYRATRATNVRVFARLFSKGRLRQAARLWLFARMGPSASIFAGPHLLAIGGLLDQQPGVAEAWAVHTDDVSRLHLGFAVVRTAHRQVGRWLAAGRYHRVQATCSHWPEATTRARFARYLTALGFAYETRLSRADALGQDVHVFARVAFKGVLS